MTPNSEVPPGTIPESSFLTKVLAPLRRWMSMPTFSGILLLVAAIAAMITANSPLAGAYQETLAQPFTFGFDHGIHVSKPLILWINDALMAVFFLLVGLEIKREILEGELASLKKATLPIAAALGGMVVPALIFMAFNSGKPTASGWGIPMATDIAFSLGVLAMLGTRAPLSVKILLTALAIVDDLGAILVIAIFYTSNIEMGYLIQSLSFFAVAALFAKLGGRHPWVYVILGAGIWYGMLKSGVHATIAGILIAIALPSRKLSWEKETIASRWEHALHPYVAFLIMPIFAYANAGVTVGSDFSSSLMSAEALGIMAGLALGKPLGITLFSWLAVQFRLASLPAGMRWSHVVGVGALGGIGFTMSLFVAELAYSSQAQYLNTAKAGVLMGSLISGLLGYTYIRCLKAEKHSS